MKAHPPTHRCKGSLKHHAPIRYQGKYNFYDKKAWHLLKVKYDDEYFTVYTTVVCEIAYCPFCGEKLPEVEE